MLGGDAQPVKPLRRRSPSEPPKCARCPKITEAEVLADPRVMEVIFLYRLGIPETDAIIRIDSWKTAAYKILAGFERVREAEEQKAAIEQARIRRK